VDFEVEDAVVEAVVVGCYQGVDVVDVVWREKGARGYAWVYDDGVSVDPS
jgi:hypothetical protein